jgi:hypothetical protein
MRDMRLRAVLSGVMALSLALALGLGAGTGVAGDEGPVFEAPLLLTSAGQSPDVQLAVVLAKRAGIEYTLAKLAVAEDLAGTRTLGLVVGASLKGLPASTRPRRRTGSRRFSPRPRPRASPSYSCISAANSAAAS